MTRTFLFALLLSVTVAETADAQIWRRARRAAERGAERAVERQAENRAQRAADAAINGMFDAGEDAARCVFTDDACIDGARSRGESVVLTDADGAPVDRSGTPVTEANAADAVVRSGTPAGSGRAVGAADANYDFVPGERVLFADDFSRDNVGDFPRRLEFREGSMEVVEFAGGRALRGKTRGAFDVVLPETLPDQFTIEFEFQATEFVNGIWLYLVDDEGERVGTNYIQVDPYSGVGLGAFGHGVGVESVQGDRRFDTQMLPVRVMADGDYVKVFADRERVANVPNADLGRTNRLRFLLEDVRSNPVYIANLRIAAGGRDLYSTLEAEGRVVTEGIYFDTASATLKPESFAVIQEIAAMLQEHPALRVRVEGHTDAQGDAGSNLSLSESRAAAVRTMLVGLGVDAGRVEAAGLGQTRPVAGNDTEAGRAQNRRVELVRL